MTENNPNVSERYRVRLEEDVYVYSDEEGILYEWDPQRQAWFPRVRTFSFYESVAYHRDGWWMIKLSGQKNYL
jgi:hypothetical protein